MKDDRIPVDHAGEAVRADNIPEGVTAPHEHEDMEQKAQSLKDAGGMPRGEAVPHDIHNPTVDVGNLPEKKEEKKELSFINKIKKFLKKRYSSDVNEIVAQKNAQRTAHFDEMRKRDATKKRSPFEVQQHNIEEVTHTPQAQNSTPRPDDAQEKTGTQHDSPVQSGQAVDIETHKTEQQQYTSSSSPHSGHQNTDEQKRNELNTNYQQNST